ncbi:MAG TPA: prepilin-type N-terminal cleavage/methylation domain-containing protein [Acidimicrobiales bacterium]|nr:prepilin-type N-terminal cleavage/methylation domain-containing protein [Acidimicrobiales bacterium]
MTLRFRRDEAAPEAGFTLIEVVVALSVMAVVAVALAGVLESGLRALAASKARSQGNEIATQGIEDLQRFSFNNLGLCAAPTGTAPTGLDNTVFLSNCPTPPAAVPYVEPCSGATGTVPDEEYACVRNNVTYTVKRYVAWSDSAQTTKRLAVFVEWDDLTGRHQVSQQSSLRAPDQAAITGLAPPAFAATPAPTVSPSNVSLNGGVLGSSLTFQAYTNKNLNGAAATTLANAVPTHQPNQNVNVQVSSAAGFPTYNGFPVTINGETFKVVAGAGSTTWTATASGTTAISSGAAVSFAGDRVFAMFRTIGANGSPQASTVTLSLTSETATALYWSATVSAADGFVFGNGSQYVTFGILRAADGKSTSAVATPAVQFCPSEDPTCADISMPRFVGITAPSPVSIGTSGSLANDVTVRATTKNVTSADTVTLTFLTQAGSVTINLSADPDTAPCAPPATAVAEDDCFWVGTITRDSGYRFPSGDQFFYFGAQQVSDGDPATIDDGSTGAAPPVQVRFQ